MKNVTIALDEDVLRAGREYVREHDTSLNSLIRRLLEQTVVRNKPGTGMEEFFRLADSARGNSRGVSWKREDLYDG